MVRTYSFLMGIGLSLVWLAGMTSPAPHWYAWLDAIAAVCAYGGATVADTVPPFLRALGPLALSAGLFGLWIVGLVTDVPAWQAWWTFVFAVGFAALGLWVAFAERATGRRTPRPV